MSKDLYKPLHIVLMVIEGAVVAFGLVNTFIQLLNQWGQGNLVSQDSPHFLYLLVYCCLIFYMVYGYKRKATSLRLATIFYIMSDTIYIYQQLSGISLDSISPLTIFIAFFSISSLGLMIAFNVLFKRKQASSISLGVIATCHECIIALLVVIELLTNNRLALIGTYQPFTRVILVGSITLVLAGRFHWRSHEKALAAAAAEAEAGADD